MPLSTSPFDDSDGILSRQLGLWMQQNISMGRHFVVFDDGRYGREKHPLIEFLEIVPTGKIEVLARMFHVVLDEPGNRRHTAVPRPLSFLRVTIDASVGKHAGYRRRNVSTRQQRCAGSVRYFMREGMHKHRCKNPHQK